MTVVARPPGKRNTTIQLLSGGEKALTAIALVFAIFELNPAPFCLLDEVDAPLDDANVGRFCELIEEMAKRVQLVLVTHNKLTMETAQQPHRRHHERAGRLPPGRGGTSGRRSRWPRREPFRPLGIRRGGIDSRDPCRAPARFVANRSAGA